MKFSRILFVILTAVFGIIAFFVFFRWTRNRDSIELIPQPSNVEYTRWELPEGAKARLGKGEINDIKFSPDGDRFAVATSIGVWLYDAQTGREISLFKGERQDVKGLAFLSDGRTLTGANSAGEIRLWNTDTGEQLSTITTTEKIKYRDSVIFSADGTKFVCAGTEAKVHVCDNSTIAAPPTITNIDLGAGFGFVPVIAFTPDQRFVATVIPEGKKGYPIHVWNADTGEHLFTLKGHTRWINTLAFSPDGKTLASGDEYKTIHLWDMGAKTFRATFKAPVSFQALAFSPSGKLLASGSGDGSVRLWNAETKQEGWRDAISKFLPALTLKGHKDKVSVLAFSPEGQVLLSGSDDGTVRAWDTTIGHQQFISQGHIGRVSSIAASKEGNAVISVHSWENQLLHWDINIGYPQSATFYKRRSPEAIARDATTLAIKDWRGKNSLKLWDISKKRTQVTLEGHEYPSSALNFVFAFSLDKKRLASAAVDNRVGVVHLWDIRYPPQSFIARFFNAKTIQPMYTFEEHTGWVLALAFSPDGEMLATSSADKTVCLWDVKTGNTRFTFTGREESIYALTFSSDAKTLVSGSYKEICLWDVVTGQLLTECQNVETAKILQFSPDHSIIVSGTYNGKIQLLDAHSCSLLSTHTGHTSWVNTLLFIEAGKTLVSGSRDGTILLWDWEKIRFGNK